MKKMNKKGFTIVELVIVIAVIAILAAVMIPTFSNVVTKAQESAAVQEVRNAYTTALADELAPGFAGTKIVSVLTQTEVVKASNGKFVDLTKDGKVSVSESTTATYHINNGKIASGAGN